jgi:hypothetical protein
MTLLIESNKKRSEPMKKRVPVKRSVSFAKVNLYHSVVTDNDDILQCRDKRRRYQRRGSKTPAMLLLSKTDLSRIQEKFFPNDSTTNANTATNASISDSSLEDMCCYTNHKNNNTSQRRLSNVLNDTGSLQQRRMSIVSSLRESLELNCNMFVGVGNESPTITTPVATPTTVTATTTAAAASAIRRRLSLDLTMQAATTVCTLPWGV